MSEEMVWDNSPQTLLADCAQLVKANSIEGAKFYFHARHILNSFNSIGNKKDDLTIIYTPAANLKVVSLIKKTFHD
jgi:hypothetical protein